MFDIRLECALHIANAEIRALDKGDEVEAVRVHDRLVSLLEQDVNEYEPLLLALARKLGRKRSALVLIEDEVVDRACA